MVNHMMLVGRTPTPFQRGE